MPKQKDRILTHNISGKTKGADNYRSPSEHLLDKSGDVVQVEPIQSITPEQEQEMEKRIKEAREETVGNWKSSFDQAQDIKSTFRKSQMTKKDRNKAQESSRVSRGRATRGRSSR